MIDQPVQRAECRQIDGRVAQGFDRPVDKIGRIAHRLCGGQHDLGYQRRSRVHEIFDIKVSADSDPVTIERGLADFAQGRARRWYHVRLLQIEPHLRSHMWG